VLWALRIAEARDGRRLHGLYVTCKKGCAACCRQWIGVTYLEAKVTLEQADRDGFEIDAKELADQVAIATRPGMTREEWFGTKCIYLTAENKCAVYDSRPAVCRALHVVSDPKHCADAGGTVQKVDNRSLWQEAALAVQSEHVQMALSPVVAALPVMVHLIKSGLGPSTLGKSVGVVGLEGHDADPRRSA
jgi:Fe-S-cluster containining protein